MFTTLSLGNKGGNLCTLANNVILRVWGIKVATYVLW